MQKKEKKLDLESMGYLYFFVEHSIQPKLLSFIQLVIHNQVQLQYIQVSEHGHDIKWLLSSWSSLVINDSDDSNKSWSAVWHRVNVIWMVVMVSNVKNEKNKNHMYYWLPEEVGNSPTVHHHLSWYGIFNWDSVRIRIITCKSRGAFLGIHIGVFRY